ncbi:HK97 family phage major capsid protein [Sagittula marina]|uniref:HK97 family phage major capsid protein n=1 Tax=Sagittula marina TaxID=943940 RepID=A0A7W6DNA2_9RHOB|nr:phage major capsid protein [Sagittula marina]MBB3986168.1 HK97 family phage major capsid protein [Sagittula marina]
MHKILELKARREALLADMDAIVNAQGDDGDADWSAEDEAKFDALKAEDDKVAAQIARFEDVERRKAAAAVPVAAMPAAILANLSDAPAPAQAAEPGLRFARMTRTIAAAGGNAYVAQQIAEANGDSALFANQSAGIATQGGFLVPEDVSSEVIELLRPASVVTAMGPRFIPMPNGNLTQNRRATGANFAYGEEQTDAPATGVTFGQVRLSAKKLRGIIPISNDLLRQTSTAVDRLIRDDAVEDAAQIQDRYFLRGVGTESTPKGLRYQLVGTPMAASNILVFGATATPSIQQVDNELGSLELSLRNRNIVVTGAQWVMSPRIENFLMNLRDGNGNKVYPEMGDGMLRKKRYHVTTEIPDNLGAGGNESEIGLIHPSHVMIGEHMGIEVAMSTEAAYKDASGKMQAAFSRDETLMRMIMQHDIGLRHLAAVAWGTGVRWGTD